MKVLMTSILISTFAILGLALLILQLQSQPLPPPVVSLVCPATNAVKTPITLGANISTPYDNIVKISISWGDGTTSNIIPPPRGIIQTLR